MNDVYISEEWRNDLLKQAEKYCEDNNISLSALGIKILNDSDFFHNIKAGKNCLADTLVKIYRFIGGNHDKNETARTRISKNHQSRA